MAPQINNINITNLINIRSNRPQHLKVKTIRFKEVDFKSFVTSSCFQCDLSSAIARFLKPQAPNFQSLKIFGDVYFADEKSLLINLLTYGVFRNRNNTITAPVRFIPELIRSKAFNYIFWSPHRLFAGLVQPFRNESSSD